MYKIIIIGAGTAGLTFAYKLSDANYEIKIYEKKKKEDLGFPWHDSVLLEAFEASGMPVPYGGVTGKKIFDMYPPDCNNSITQRKKTETGGIEIDRKFFIDFLINIASTHARIEYEKEAVGLITFGNTVVGVKFDDGTTEYCNLVVDGSGAFSALRKSVPLYDMDAEPLEEDMLYCTRAIYKAIDGVFTGKKDSVYLKHLGMNGISWCRTAPISGDMDVFVSLIGEKLSPEYVEKAETDIREKNPAVSQEQIVRRYEKLVVRYPLSRFVFDGYVAIGDSAYMSMPINGSGIEGAMRAGSLLAECISNCEGCFDTAHLWSYQTSFVRSYGSNLLVYDIFRRYLLGLKVEEINWVFNTLLSDEIKEIADTDFEHIKSLKFSSIIKKLPTVFERKDMVSGALKMLRTALAAKTTAVLIPAFFEKRIVSSWEKRYNSYIRERKYESVPK